MHHKVTSSSFSGELDLTMPEVRRSLEHSLKSSALEKLQEYLHNAQLISPTNAALENLLLPLSSAILLAFPFSSEGEKRLGINELVKKLEAFGITNQDEIQAILGSELDLLVECGLLDKREDRYLLRPASLQKNRLNQLRTDISHLRRQLHTDLARLSPPESQSEHATNETSPDTSVRESSPLKNPTGRDKSLEGKRTRARNKAIARARGHIEAVAKFLTDTSACIPPCMEALREHENIMRCSSIREITEGDLDSFPTSGPVARELTRCFQSTDPSAAFRKLAEREPIISKKMLNETQQLMAAGVTQPEIEGALEKRFLDSISHVKRESTARIESYRKLAALSEHHLSQLSQTILHLEETGYLDKKALSPLRVSLESIAKALQPALQEKNLSSAIPAIHQVLGTPQALKDILQVLSDLTTLLNSSPSVGE